MAFGLQSIARSLEFRLLVPLAATITVVLSVHAVLGYWGAREQALRFVQADLDRSVALIQNATHDGMLLNRMGELQSRIERLGATAGFSAIRVYAKDGRISLSADPSERDTVVDLRSATCLACHPSGTLRGSEVLEDQHLARASSGSDGQRRLIAIRNEPGCAIDGCHPDPSQAAVLGVLDVEMTMAPFDQAVAAVRRQLVWTTLALIVASSAVAFLFIRQLVHRPVALLREGTRRIAAGDLETRIEVGGSHELAALGEAFNRMVGELRSARDEVERWSQTLEAKVKEKTEELRVVEQGMSRVETMVSLGKLSATVAHELNNPLGGVLAYARLIRRELAEQPLEATIREELDSYLELVEKECARCGGIVKNLLLFARGSGARLAPTDLNQVVERSLMLVRHHLEIQKIASQATYLEGDPTIVADQGQIQQVVLALLMNAIEAMQAVEGKGEGRKGLLGVHLAGDAEQVSIRVSDTGVGIPADLIPHIFKPFVTTKGSKSGVGLGLSVVYGVVHGHGGAIAVQSEPGLGTTFTITLPRERPAGDGRAASPALAMEARP